ncbi:MAG: class I SAM-dependent RNA methyltransferase [Flavobacteriales bacterium]|nr:class I SAM-dependent RNA methyltransferase [Flavobacteriales bacterium]
MSADVHQLTATTLAGFEEILAHELRSFGARDVEIGKRAVYFKGDLGFIYKVNFRSRFALRVLKPIKSFVAMDESAYYARIKAFPWENYLSNDKTFSIKCALNSQTFTHSLYMSLKAKDAIVDRLREKTGDRPNVDRENPDLPIHVHIDKELVTLSLDSTGHSLHMRGYRQITGQAPINEVLAAGIVELSGWDPVTPFYDGMCGSGTIAIEAAIKGLNMPPGLFRKLGYSFEKWPDFDQKLFDTIIDGSMERISNTHLKIYASDVSANVVSKAKKNIYGAELDEDIQVSVQEFLDLKPTETRGTLVLNPPYGDRMDKEDIDELYKNLGDAFKQNWKGFSCFMITGNLGALKKVGLKSTSKLELFNGSIECRLARFDVYEGSKKHQS